MRSLAVGSVVVLTVDEARIDLDGFQLHAVERDLVGRRRRRRGEYGEPRDALGLAHTPLERVHAAHRAADDRGPHVDAERIRKAHLGGDLVADGQVRKASRPFVPVGGDRRRSRRALASTEHVRGDDEPAVGVDGGARAHDVVPPARGGMTGSRGAAHVTVAGEGMQHEHRVVTAGRQLAPGLVGQADAGKLPTALGREGAERGEAAVAGGIAVAPGARRRRAAAQQARVGLRDRCARHRVFGGLPVHALLLPFASFQARWSRALGEDCYDSSAA